METLFVGKNLLFLPEVESTNTYAMHMLRNVNVIEGTLVYTDNQTKGKGQRGAVWNSAIASNITASIVLKPLFLSVENSFYLSKISALAIYDVLTDVLENSQYDIKIKWPNDIFVNSKKIAGVLIENNYNNANLQYSVIGMGININQVDFSGLENIATSLKLLSGKHFDRVEILEKVCGYLEKWYLTLKANKLQHIDENYLQKLLGLNEQLFFKNTDNSLFKGMVINVDTGGKLCLQMPDKSIKKFEIKELQFVHTE